VKKPLYQSAVVKFNECACAKEGENNVNKKIGRVFSIDKCS
jgi:hypothetical protein